MTYQDLEWLTLPHNQEFIESHLHHNPAKLALSIQKNGEPVHLVTSQIKYLQRARHKLPTYYNHRCILPPVSYEQASSERATQLRPYQGHCCLDLTCGLGVDVLRWSEMFAQVEAIELSSILVEVARHNFARMGLENINFHANSAEKFLQDFVGEEFDFVFVDPDRRVDQGQRSVRLEDWKPDVIRLRERILEIGKQLVCKLSPLYDLKAAQTQFTGLKKSIVLSIDNEVKEVLLEMDREQYDAPQVEVWLDRKGIKTYYQFEDSLDEISYTPDFSSAYIYEADTAFYKARKVGELFAQHFPSLRGSLNHAQAYFFSEQLWQGEFPGRVFKLIEAMPYKPKKLKKYLKEAGYTRLNVAQRNFLFKTAEIRKQLGIREGGELFLICTQTKEEKWAFLVERVR